MENATAGDGEGAAVGGVVGGEGVTEGSTERCSKTKAVVETVPFLCYSCSDSARLLLVSLFQTSQKWMACLFLNLYKMMFGRKK